MYGTINTLYKDYIKDKVHIEISYTNSQPLPRSRKSKRSHEESQIDGDQHPDLEKLVMKYYSKSLFSIDKTEHKKMVKEKKRELKRIKKQQAHKELMRKKREELLRLSRDNNKDSCRKTDSSSSNKNRTTQKRMLKKIA